MKQVCTYTYKILFAFEKNNIKLNNLNMYTGTQYNNIWITFTLWKVNANENVH